MIEQKEYIVTEEQLNSLVFSESILDTEYHNKIIEQIHLQSPPKFTTIIAKAKADVLKKLSDDIRLTFSSEGIMNVKDILEWIDELKKQGEQ